LRLDPDSLGAVLVLTTWKNLGSATNSKDHTWASHTESSGNVFSSIPYFGDIGLWEDISKLASDMGHIVQRMAQTGTGYIPLPSTPGYHHSGSNSLPMRGPPANIVALFEAGNGILPPRSLFPALDYMVRQMPLKEWGSNPEALRWW
jgi:hypothetical protein